MRKLITIALLFISGSTYAQSWVNTGNALQQQTGGSYKNWRFNLGTTLGFLPFYSKTQTDSAVVAVTGNYLPINNPTFTGVLRGGNHSGNSYNENIRLDSSALGFSTIAFRAVGVTGTGVGQWSLSSTPLTSGNARSFQFDYNGTKLIRVDTTGKLGAVSIYQNGNQVANDNAVVHNTGNERINGIKTYLSDIKIGGALAYSKIHQDTTLNGNLYFNTYNSNSNAPSFIFNSIYDYPLLEMHGNGYGGVYNFKDGKATGKTYVTFSAQASDWNIDLKNKVTLGDVPDTTADLDKVKVLVRNKTTGKLYEALSSYFTNKPDSATIASQYYTKTQADSLLENKGKTQVVTNFYTADFSIGIGAEFNNTGGWTTTTGGITATAYGLSNLIQLNKQYNAYKRSGDFVVTFGSDTRVAFFTKQIENNQTLSTIFEVDASAGKLKIYQPYGDNGTFPSVLSDKNISITTSHDYTVRMIRDQYANGIILIDNTTAHADSLFDYSNSSGRQYDSYCLAAISGTFPVVKSWEVNTPIAKGVKIYNIGDSITDGVYLTDTLQRFDQMIINAFGGDGAISGRGGGTITGVNNRVETEIAILKPQAVSILIGTNSGNTVSNLTALVSRLRAIGITTIFLNHIPWRSDNANIARNADIETVCAAQGLQSLRFDIATSKDYLNMQADSSLFDQAASPFVHPNVAGHLRMFQRVFTADAPGFFKFDNYEKIVGNYLQVGEVNPLTGVNSLFTDRAFVNSRASTMSAGLITVSYGGTPKKPTPVTANKIIGGINSFGGYDNTGTISTGGGGINIVSTDAPWTATNQGAYGYFNYTPAGATAQTRGWTVTRKGQLMVGITPVNGFYSPDSVTNIITPTLKVTTPSTGADNTGLVTFDANGLVQKTADAPRLSTGTGPKAPVYQGDLNSLAGETIVFAGNSATNRPVSSPGFVITHQFSTNTQNQTYFRNSDDRVYFRNSVSGVWGSWREMYHSGSTPTFTGTVTAPAATISGFTTAGIVTNDASGVLSTSTALPSGTTATTPTGGDNSTQIATTAFVQAAVSGVSGVNRVSPIDSLSAVTNGAQVSGNNLVLQSATPTKSGLINTTTQYFAGTKQFSDQVIAANTSFGVTTLGPVVWQPGGGGFSVNLRAPTGPTVGYNLTLPSSGGTLALTSDIAIKAHTIFTPTTGSTVALINNQYNIINPTGALLALTVNLPSSPANNDVVYIKYTQSVTMVTYGGGTVVDGIASPVAGGLVVLTYDSGTTSWY